MITTASRKKRMTQILANLWVRRAAYTGLLWCVFLLAACRGEGGMAVDAPTPTPLPTPIVPEKPTYVVQQGTVVQSLQFTGRVAPVQEQALFFRTDGFVDQVFVSRGNRVEQGDVLAQLEISGLENQLAQAQIALQTAETRLAQAEQTTADDLAEAQINLQKIELQLQQGQINSNTAVRPSAQSNLEKAKQQVVAHEYEVQKSLDG